MPIDTIAISPVLQAEIRLQFISLSCIKRKQRVKGDCLSVEGRPETTRDCVFSYSCMTLILTS